MYVCILHERPCPAIFYNFSGKFKPHISNMSITVPESPIYSLNSTLGCLEGLENCALETLSILNDMKSLTDAFLVHHRNEASGQHSDASTEFKSYAQTIQAQLSARPSASDVLSPLSKDYQYEFVRLASVIYTESLVSRVPIATAFRIVDSKSPSSAPNILQAMCIAFSKTNLTNCWGGMAGVLLWGSLIGATAAKGLMAGGNENLEKFKQTRRWLTVTSLGCMVIIATEHCHAITGSLRQMLEIQRVLNGGTGESMKNQASLCQEIIS
jgi:hypothetical protein